MSDTAATVPQNDPLPEGCQLKDASVNFSGMSPHIVAFLRDLAPQWKASFDEPLVITSARDGQHAETGGHPRGMAVDIRTANLTAPERLAAARMIVELQDSYRLRFYDESRLPSGGHFHVDTVG